MTWKLDLLIVILIIAILFVVYLMISVPDRTQLVNDTTTVTTETTIEQTTTNELPSTTSVTTEETTTTVDTTVPTTILETTTTMNVTTTTVETTVLEGNLFISGIELNGTDALAEWVEITASGRDYELMNYTLKDLTGYTYTFSEFTLVADASVKVHTGSGTDTAMDVYWNRGSAVWNNAGDTATLSYNATVIDEKTCHENTCWFTE